MIASEPLESLTKNGDKLFNHNKSQSEPSIPPASSPSIEIGTSQVTQPPITTADNKVLNTAITSNSTTTVPATSCTQYKVSLTQPRAVTTVTNSISTPVTCHKLPPDPEQISTPAARNSPWRGWTVPNQAASPRPSLVGPSHQPQQTWSLMPTFPGPPQDKMLG